MVYKSPLAQAQALNAPRTFTPEEATKHMRGILANDRNNSVFEAYDEYLQSHGKPLLVKTSDNGQTIYPKNYHQTILNDKDFMADVLKNMQGNEDNYMGDFPATDQDIIANLKWMGYKFED